MLFRFIAFGFIGMSVEVALKGVWHAVSTKKLDFSGDSSLIKFPFYGLVAFIYPLLFNQIKGFEWFIRGILYAILFFVGEYLVVKLLHKLRFHSESSLKSMLIRTPIWFLIGLCCERVFPLVKAAAYQGI